MSRRITPHGVVVGVDGSPSSSAAVRWAVGEAVSRHVGLTVVHIVPPMPVATSTLGWPVGQLPDEILEIQESDGRRIVADAVELAGEGLSVDARPEINGEFIFGGIVPTLADLSKDAALTVVGCRGRTARHRRLLGSISTGLIHHGHGPIAVVHDEAPPLSGSAHLPVLLGIDGSRASELATEIAFDEASRRAVDLVALHVWSDTDVPLARSLEASALQSGAEEVLSERLGGWHERYPEVVVHRLVKYDHPAQQLLDESERAQLIVVGSHGRGGFAGMLLGSVGTAVAEAARVPVIVARHR
ncbi:nucleotide-binding universal stress UspA family protein [Mycobacterium frederiksbergense]|uniref:Nucleotide-binding universal stress UspA family protein n=1 Tax=Mycolicibacterium frederiksbergense TaxID=117567 RepID=A0ABT6KTC9_9MYCO|nr:universal stress protein [Mycolicibacterium frederiksbergense]MDH6193987.1 nucleotide-binding universal stress UspA family protein [Mycolicibacterium frederiksbergense]